MKNFLRKLAGCSSLIALTVIASVGLLVSSCGGSSNGNGSQAATFSISGSVTSGSAALAGVTITLSGTASATTTTDASGSYSFGTLANGSYTVTPGKTGFTFSPASSPQTVNGANISGVTFTATAVPATFSISGTVTSGGTGLAGVTMALSGAGTATVNTDSTGFYTFSGLANGSYTVTPHKAGYTLSPAGSPQTISGANIATVDFSATLPQLARIVACPLSGYTQVSVTDSGFNPATVSVAINGIVKWSNSGPSIHTVTSGTSPTADGIFNTGDIAATGLLGAACVQYLAVGSYPYFCTYHPTMTGTVTVH